MDMETIEKVEREPLFKIFLRRIGFKNTDEYYNLFGGDMEKRITAVKWFLQTYPKYNLK